MFVSENGGCLLAKMAGVC